MNFGEWQTCNYYEQCPPSRLHRWRPSSAFQARRGRPWLRAGVEKATAWLPCASEPRFKTEKSSPFFSSSPLFFQSPSPLLRRTFAAVVVPPPSRQSLFQLRLLLAHLANQPWSLAVAGKRRLTPFFPAAGSTTVASASPWPTLSGEPLLLLGTAPASP